MPIWHRRFKKFEDALKSDTHDSQIVTHVSQVQWSNNIQLFFPIILPQYNNFNTINMLFSFLAKYQKDKKLQYVEQTSSQMLDPNKIQLIHVNTQSEQAPICLDPFHVPSLTGITYKWFEITRAYITMYRCNRIQYHLPLIYHGLLQLISHFIYCLKVVLNTRLLTFKCTVFQTFSFISIKKKQQTI